MPIPNKSHGADSLAEVAATADFLQESVPEDAEIKGPVHVELDATAPSDVIISSSSSGLLPSEMQSVLEHRERFVVGHPFNPVYLLPLVEFVAGQETSADTVESAVDHYRTWGCIHWWSGTRLRVISRIGFRRPSGERFFTL